MGNSKYKIKLSPKLQLGIGRNTSQTNYFRYIGVLFLIISLFLAGRVVWVVSTHQTETANPQVLGATDTVSTNSQDLVKEVVVQKGDTIFSIAQANDIPWTTLASLNNLKSPFTLKTGQKLKIPNK